MFTGMTAADLLISAQDVGAIFSVPLLVAAIYWAGSKLVFMGRAFFRA